MFIVGGNSPHFSYQNNQDVNDYCCETSQLVCRVLTCWCCVHRGQQHHVELHVPASRDMDTSTMVTVKKEPSNSSDEMKEFAETAMNELLGWYGYEPEAEPDEDDTDARKNTGDSSGPEYSDSGGGGGWCGWCSKPMSAGAQATGTFCSELCFSQSRRASFKRNRTCDWCRTTRNSVSHVDVRDGARRLQFCGDSCLNQYKMHIFCRETRAHLQLHPHTTLPTSGTGLITPELWLKDCRQNESPPLQSVPSPSIPRRRLRKPPRSQPTVTSSTSTGCPEPATAVLEGPQDLRTRPRSPADTPAEAAERPKPTWPPPPLPVTLLVPYPIVIPVPLPLPLPIPIPVPDEVFKRATSASSGSNNTTTVNVSTTTATISPSSVTPSDTKQSRRILRARKRPAQPPRTTVPA